MANMSFKFHGAVPTGTVSIRVSDGAFAFTQAEALGAADIDTRIDVPLRYVPGVPPVIEATNFAGLLEVAWPRPRGFSRSMIEPGVQITLDDYDG